MAPGRQAAPAPSRGPAGRPGRPLDPGRDEAIMAAVVDVLARLGHDGLTMDEVALTAGVGKAAIYRRWAGRTELLASYTETSLDHVLDASDTGSLRTDLVALLRSAADHVNGPAGRANRALLSAVHGDPLLAAAYRAGPLARWSAAFQDVFDRAAARGEVGPAAVPPVVAEAGAAIVVQRWLLTGTAVDDALVTSVVDEVVLPLLCRTDPAAVTPR